MFVHNTCSFMVVAYITSAAGERGVDVRIEPGIQRYVKGPHHDCDHGGDFSTYMQGNVTCSEVDIDMVGTVAVAFGKPFIVTQGTLTLTIKHIDDPIFHDTPAELLVA